MPISIVEIPEEEDEKLVRKMFPKYFEILERKAVPKFQAAKENGILDEKIEKAFKILKSCHLCERNCNVNRTINEKGYCKLNHKMSVDSYFEHKGEEFFLIPSMTIFFWSCNFACQYCQNWAISQRKTPIKKVDESKMAGIIDEFVLHSECKNVNLVGGEPSLQIPNILKMLKGMKSNVPVIFNSNFYMSLDSMDLLKDVVDIYLSDFKYGNDRCAERLSKVPNYLSVVQRNHLLAAKDSELLIRHLLLPGHFECCTKPILEWIAKNLKNRAVVNIMGQYRPEYKASEYTELRRLVSEKEKEEAANYAKKLGLKFIS